MALDPIYVLGSQTLRLTENTQRSSDQLRSHQLKESKEKGGRSRSPDTAQLSGDLSSMGDDLMGSMDPDLMGGGGGAELFRRFWEETVEKEAEPEEPSLPLGWSQPDGSLDPVNPLVELVPPALDLPEGGATGWDTGSAGGAAPGGSPAEPVAPPPVAPAAASSWEEGRPSSVTLDVEVGPPRVHPPGAAAPPGSLLDPTAGFLLRESQVEFQACPESSPPAQERFDGAMEAVLGRLLRGEPSSPAWPGLRGLVARFGVGVLSQCASAGVTIHLLPRGGRLGDEPQVRAALGEEAEGAAYLPGSRACWVEEGALTARPFGFHPVLFYVASAWDHALGGEDFASLRSPAVLASFQAARAGLTGHAFPDGMAQADPARYFAQAVEAFLSQGDCQDPLWTREDLHDLDSSMYHYIDYLLGQGNRPG